VSVHPLFVTFVVVSDFAVGESTPKANRGFQPEPPPELETFWSAAVRACEYATGVDDVVEEEPGFETPGRYPKTQSESRMMITTMTTATATHGPRLRRAGTAGATGAGDGLVAGGVEEDDEADDAGPV
jgi:hypothetical protein